MPSGRAAGLASGLSWTAAARIATRELRSAAGRFAFVIVAVALGVGALTGVRAFSQSFRAMLIAQARTLMAGDIELHAPVAATPEQAATLAGLARAGVASTRITESVSMVSGVAAAGPGANPVLTTLKAVDPRLYPFAGSVTTAPAGALAGLDDQSVLVSPDLLLRLGLAPGGELTVAGRPFRIAGVDEAEPDRLAGGIGIGPRLLLTQGGLARTGIIQFGSQVQSRLIFRLGPGTPGLAQVEASLRAAFPHARLDDYSNGNPTVARGLDHSTTFLSLISLMALIVGALGVASAMHAHLQLRLDSIATMKVLGARTAQIVRIYGLQTLLLGLAGGVLGVGLSAMIERVFPHLLAQFFPHLPALGWAWGPAAEGLIAGVLVTLLFTLPTLLAIREMRPALILRRALANQMRLPAPAAAITALVLLLGVAGLAVALSDEPWRQALSVGGYFLAALSLGIAALAATTWILLWLLRRLLARVRLPLALRHGCANLYRPGAQTMPVLVALGLGVMFTLSVFLLQHALLADLQADTPPGVANVFLIDVPPAQAGAVLARLRHQAGLEDSPELIGTVAARPQGGLAEPNADASEGGDGRSVGYARRAMDLATYADPPEGITVVRGAWWRHPDPDVAQAAVSQSLAARRHLQLGEELRWTVADRSITARIAAIYEPEPHRMIARLDAILSPGALAGLPRNINGGVRVAPAAIPELERDLYARFPTVTVVNLADVIERVQVVVDQITLLVHFVSFFAVLAGAIILASSVAGTRFRRMREIAVLKTCGATRGRIVRIFSTEFLVLGLVAGLAGSLLAAAFTHLLTTRVLAVAFHPDPAAVALAIAATAAIAVAAGWLASTRILGLKPLAVLRGE